MKNQACLTLLLFLVLSGCSENDNPVAPHYYSEKPVFEVTVLKWYKGKTAAVSINYDAPWGRNKDVDSIGDEVLSRGLRMDHELVTSSYEKYPDIVAKMRDEAIPGVSIFTATVTSMYSMMITIMNTAIHRSRPVSIS